MFSWTDSHLHRFVIRAKEYGVAYEGGVSFADDPEKARLSDFRFRPLERFGYLYDFGDNWDHDIIVEKIVSLDPALGGKCSPRFVLSLGCRFTGSGGGPPCRRSSGAEP